MMVHTCVVLSVQRTSLRKSSHKRFSVLLAVGLGGSVDLDGCELQQVIKL